MGAIPVGPFRARAGTVQTLERLILLILVGVVGFLVGRSDRPLLADGTADSNSKMIAVAAPYQAGVSLLYVIDTQNRQLAVYEARGGSKSSGRLVFVAARKIDLDLRLEGYHDDSEFSFADLTASFRKSGWTEPKDAPKVGASETSEVQVPKKDK